jgi:hypothetical protein
MDYLNHTMTSLMWILDNVLEIDIKRWLTIEEVLAEVSGS